MTDGTRKKKSDKADKKGKTKANEGTGKYVTSGSIFLTYPSIFFDFNPACNIF